MQLIQPSFGIGNNLCRNNLSVSDDDDANRSEPLQQFLNLWRANFFPADAPEVFAASAASFTGEKETSWRALGPVGCVITATTQSQIVRGDV